MIIQAIKNVIQQKGITTKQLSQMANISHRALTNFLNGAPAISAAKVEHIFRVLSLHFRSCDEFLAYGYDFRSAVERGLKKLGYSKYRLAQKCGISAMTIGAYLRNEHTPNVNKIAQMLAALGLSVVECEPPERLPMVAAETKEKIIFPLGVVIKDALAARGITAYRFAKDNGISTGGFTRLINLGEDIGSERTERLLAKLGVGIEPYGSDFRRAISETMAAKGICTNALAKRLGINQSALRSYLIRQSNMSVKRVSRIVEELGLRFERSDTPVGVIGGGVCAV